ncbi:MAG TPA: pilus assembly protein TadG-related protein [Pirellulales bacterium]|jgi:Flp pilus assembly protein TadG|nr:pilus assembly protein TadG-related protein [Pirellulales bacterium]
MKRQLRSRSFASQRRGTTLVLVAVCMIPLMACVALAIDLGLLMAARTQVSCAADLAAMAGARALNGITANSENNNYSDVLPTAQTAVAANSILGTAVTSSQVSVNIGRYAYNTSTQQFEGVFTSSSTDNWSLVQATVSVPVSSHMFFSKMFSFTEPNIQATATAAHRPRDVAIVLDFSGSMRFSSLMGTPYSGGRTSGNNPDTIVPAFGHYSGVTMPDSSPTYPYGSANITTTTSDGRPPIVSDFYTNSSGTLAFSAAPSSYMSTPAGDVPKKTNKNTGSSYAQTAAQLLNISSPGNSTRDATFETSGYQAYSMATTFSGYTQGPGYWGKTFYLWPPDPRAANDWRKKYFYYYDTTTACDDNSLLWDSSGSWTAPGSGSYSVNYTAILNFIKSVGPSIFPTQLESGRIVYYTSIPSSITTSSWPPSDLNERFWKDYIDYVLGIMQAGTSSWSTIDNGNTAYTGYGPDFSWGTVKITAKSSLSGSPKPYMHYGDNPQRPQTGFWFGPMSMVDFLGNYNMWYDVSPTCSRYCYWPGTCHESPTYALKLGIRAALTDIQNNHPNDYVSLVMFSDPQSSSSDDDGSRFNRVRVGLGRNYSNMLDSLWYPVPTIGNSSATVTPYDSMNLEVPRAMGGTCYSYALMLAYNQFSGNTSLQSYNTGQTTGDAGGMGRKGAQKMIIFETDGCPNTTANASLTNSGAYNSYYNIRYNSNSPSGSQYPTGVGGYNDNDSTVTSQVYSICNQICAADSASPPGYSTTNKPVKINCIAFGPIVTAGGAEYAGAMSTLTEMQTIGSVTDNMPSYKVVNGTQSQMVTNLQTAFQKIMADGVQITLIQ